MTRAINDPGNEDPGSLLETDADALLGGAAVQAPEERCRLASQDCIRACERYLALCTESSREQRQHAGDCADLCRLAALLLERRSPWAPAACELAARYALACAERCDGDEPLERECAGACRRFVEACRPLLPAEAGHFCRRGLESECAGQADFLACPGFSFRLPRRAPFASVCTDRRHSGQVCGVAGERPRETP